MSLSWAGETLEFVECAAGSTHVLFVYSPTEIPLGLNIFQESFLKGWNLLSYSPSSNMLE
jgi:hypothetical protein